MPAGATIVVLEGFYEGLELPVARAWVVIGRGRGADVMIAEPTISARTRRWARSCRFSSGLGGTTGTLVNGAREKKQVLKDGDEIQMGGAAPTREPAHVVAFRTADGKEGAVPENDHVTLDRHADSGTVRRMSRFRAC